MQIVGETTADAVARERAVTVLHMLLDTRNLKSVSISDGQVHASAWLNADEPWTITVQVSFMGSAVAPEQDQTLKELQHKMGKTKQSHPQGAP